jgi:hypothetical protein
MRGLNSRGRDSTVAAPFHVYPPTAPDTPSHGKPGALDDMYALSIRASPISWSSLSPGKLLGKVPAPSFVHARVDTASPARLLPACGSPHSLLLDTLRANVDILL